MRRWRWHVFLGVAVQEIGETLLLAMEIQKEGCERSGDVTFEEAVEMSAVQGDTIELLLDRLGQALFPKHGLVAWARSDGVFELMMIVKEAWGSQELERSKAGVSEQMEQGEIPASQANLRNDQPNLRQGREGEGGLDVRLDPACDVGEG